MNFQLRVAFFVVGLLILFGVIIDYFRRKNFAQNLDLDTFIDQNGSEPILDFQIEPDPEIESVTIETNLIEPEREPEPEPEPELASEPASALVPIKDIIAIHVISRDPRGFHGATLHRALINANLFFGRNNMFHSSELEFSVAKAVEPGYFDLDKLNSEFVAGVSLILLPAKVKNPLLALDKLIRVAKQVSFVLNAELLDYAHEALTLNTIDFYRKQLQAN